MTDEKSQQTPEPQRPTDPGVTTWASGEVTDGDNEAGDLTTAGEPLRAETGQSSTLDDVRPGP